MLNETILNSTLQRYITGSIDKGSLLSYLAQHFFLIPILIIVLLPMFIVLGVRIVAGKMSREAFWTTYVISIIIAVIMAILTLIGIFPLNLNI